MTWSFLAPLYLLGGLALAIPIWVHLRNRTPLKPYLFPALRFLIETRVVSHRQRNIMRWLVLFFRLLAIAALVLAFARPFRHLTLPPSGELSILILDVSCSMMAGETWKEAQKNALEWFNNETKTARTAIVLMGRSPRILSSFESSPAEQQNALSAVTPTYESTNPEAALRFANHLLDSQSAKKKKITVISDMTLTAWKNIQWDQPLSPGITMDPRGVNPVPPDHCAITEIKAPLSFWQTNVAFNVTATLKNYTAKPRDLEVLFTNEELLKTKSILLAPHSTQEVAFEVFPTEFNPMKGVLRLKPTDEFAPDNERFFCVLPRRPLRVGRLSAEKDSDTYLKMAVMPKSDFASNRYQWIPMDLDLNPKVVGTIADRDLSKRKQTTIKEQADILFLDQGRSLSSEYAGQIKNFVNEGGTAVLFLGESNRLADWEKEFLPIDLGKKHEAGKLSEPQHFVQIQANHPILRPFFLPRGGDLFKVKIQQWREFRIPTGQPLIQLANGDPILAIAPQGKGQIVVFAFPFTREWSDWPIQATFLPIIHQTLAWLEEKQPQRQGMLVGDPVMNGSPSVQPGFLSLSQNPSDICAINIDSDESDLARWKSLATFQKLENLDKNLSPVSAGYAENPDHPGMDSPQRTNLTWWFILAAIIFSFSELTLANRTPR